MGYNSSSFFSCKNNARKKLDISFDQGHGADKANLVNLAMKIVQFFPQKIQISFREKVQIIYFYG